MCKDDLVKIIVYNIELSKLFEVSRYIHITVMINGERGLIDHSLHAGYTKTFIAVDKASIYQALFAELEDLMSN